MTNKRLNDESFFKKCWILSSLDPADFQIINEKSEQIEFTKTYGEAKNILFDYIDGQIVKEKNSGDNCGF